MQRRQLVKRKATEPDFMFLATSRLRVKAGQGHFVFAQHTVVLHVDTDSDFFDAGGWSVLT